MAMSLASIKKSTSDNPPFAIFYGVAGVGKTSLAAEAPGAIFLCTSGEAFPTGVEADAFPEARTFADVIEAIGVLANEEHEFKTFVIDAADGIEALVHAETCARNGWLTIEDPGFGKGYVAAVNVWGEILDGLKFLRAEKRMNIILLAHTTITRFDSPTTDPYSRYGINLQKRSEDIIRSAADLVVFLNYRVTLKSADAGFNKKVTHGEGGGARVMYVEERPGFIAKNRFGMPPSIDYKKDDGWPALVKYIPAASA